MTNGPNSRKPQPRSTTIAVEERQRQRRRAGAADRIIARAGDRGDDEFAREPRAAGEAEMRLLGHLQIIVVEADRGEAERDEQHDPDIGARQARPQQRGGEQAEQDHQPAHRRRALLGQQMRGRPVGADRLALALFEPQRRDDRGAEEEHQKQPGRRRAERAERQIAEQIERRRRCGKSAQPGQHLVLASRPARRAKMFAQKRGDSGPMRRPLEPLIITTSPARSAPRPAARASSLGALGVGGAHRGRRGVVERARQRARRRTADRRGWLRGRPRDRRACAAPSGPSSSMSPMTAMRRPPGPGLAAPSSASAARIEAGLAL